MKKIVLTCCVMATVAMFFSGCSSKSTTTDEGSKQLEEIDVVLDWYPNAVHAFIYEAIEKGYYEEEGLKVNVLSPTNGSDAITMTAAGKADIGFYYQNECIMHKVNEDIPIKTIGTVVQEPLDIVASVKEKNITSPKDLEGKKIGLTGTIFSEEAIKKLVRDNGADVDKVEIIDVGFDLMSSMTTNKVDATFGCFINHEIPQLEEEGFEMNYFKLTDFGVPNYYALVLVVGEKNLEQKKEQYAAFLRASQKGFEDMKNSPEEALQILLKNQNVDNFPLKESVEKKSFDILLPIMEKENAPFLTQDLECWSKNVDWLYEAGLIDEKIDPSEIVTTLE